MSYCNKEKITDLAYNLWEEAGKPEGDGFDFWIRAEEVVCNNHTKVEMKKNKPMIASLVPTVLSYRPNKVNEHLIRLVAYYLWEEAGKPEGDGVNFWLEAERKLHFYRE